MVSCKHLLVLTLAKNPVVDKDTVQPVADRPMDQRRCDRGIHSAAKRHDHLPLADLFLQGGNGIADKMRRRPVLFATANIDKKIPDDLLSFDGVIYFRMELPTEQRLPGRHSSCASHTVRAALYKRRIGNILRIRQHL